jgi:signal transduction histidine kinase
MRRWNRKARKPGGRNVWASLTWILFFSIVLVMFAVFLAVQFLGILPEANSHSLAERMDIVRLGNEATDNLPLISLIVGFMMIGIYAALRLGLRPLQRISKLAAEIGPSTISRRLPLESTPREIAPLVVAFNSALDRIESGWRDQREFSANAAHELRTPLATLRAQIENLLEPLEREEAMEEFDRLSRLITQLLALAEADRAEEMERSSFNLVEVARRVTLDMAAGIVAGERNISFDAATKNWTCEGSPQLVEVAIRNLLENAIRHTWLGSEIIVAVDQLGSVAVIDDGPGLPEDFRERAFDRFSKASIDSLGAGLGLSIVQRIMNFHGGEARLEATSQGAHVVLDFAKRKSEESTGQTRNLRSPDRHKGESDSTPRLTRPISALWL